MRFPDSLLVAELGLKPFSLDSEGGELLWFLAEAIAGGEEGNEKWTRVEPLGGEHVRNVSLGPSHSGFPMGLSGWWSGLSLSISKSLATEWCQPLFPVGGSKQDRTGSKGEGCSCPLYWVILSNSKTSQHSAYKESFC